MIVEYLNLDRARAASPSHLRGVNLLDMAAAPVEAHLAEIVVLRLDLDRCCARAVRFGNVLVRQLFKVGVLENPAERPDEIVVGAYRSLRGRPRRGSATSGLK